MVGDVLCINLLEVYVQARLPVYSKLSLVNYSSIPATSSANGTLHYGNSFIDEIQIFTDGTFLLYCLNCEMSSCQKHMKFYVVPTVLSFQHRLRSSCDVRQPRLIFSFLNNGWTLKKT